MKTKTYLLLLVILFPLYIHAQATQQPMLSGIVNDENGIPLPGVNIVIQGTAVGTQTNFEGEFRIAASIGVTLQFSYVGYNDYILEVENNEDDLSISMDSNGVVISCYFISAQGIKFKGKSKRFSSKYL